jgi:hypothetical protein
MNRENFRRAIRIAGLVLPLGWMPGSVAGQMLPTATGQSFGVSVSTSSLNQTTPYVVLPIDGSTTVDQGQSIVVNGLVSAQDAFAIVGGDADPTYGSNSVSSSTLGSVNLLNGLITADGVVAVATSTTGGGFTGSDAAGSSIANLVVNGVAVSDPTPNTQLSLPGVGYVVLNEQISTGDGVTTSGITVNMIHVVLLDPLTGAKTGEIIVGSASSAVGN